MTSFLRIFAVLFALSTAACTADSTDDEPTAAADSELRSVSFFTRAPLGGRRLETLRRSLDDASSGFVWVRNQGTVSGLQWEGKAADTAQGPALVRGALGFLGHRGARDVKMTTDLEGALDTVGLAEASPDESTHRERAKILDALRDIAKTKGVTVFTATLHDAPDMYWENVLVVVDAESHQLVVATGGFGT